MKTEPTPCPAQFNAAQYVLSAARTTPDKTALQIIDHKLQVQTAYTYGALDAAVRGTATGLKSLGIKQGDKVILRLGNTALFPVSFLAAVTLGAIPVPTSSQLTKVEIERIIDDLGDAKAIILGNGLTAPSSDLTIISQDKLADLENNPPLEFTRSLKNDPAYIVYTSGSSGTPKGVVHAHRALWARRMMWTGWYDLRPDDVMLHAGALNWTFTLGTGLMDPWAIGASALVYAGEPDRHIWSKIAHKFAATLFAAAPGVYRQLLTSPNNLSADFSTLRHALSAGEALPEPIRDLWGERTGTDIYESLGMSEVSTFISGRPGDFHMLGTVGKPQPGRNIAILEDGADDGGGIIGVHKSDPGLMLGYYRKGASPQLPLKDDYFATGDRGRFDEDNRLTYLGRSDTLLTVGGFRIAPEEVEKTLMSHPEVTEAAVTSIKVKDGVYILAAFYAGPGQIEYGALESYMKERTAAYKLPRHYQHVTALPRRANGKLARRELTKLWSTQT